MRHAKNKFKVGRTASHRRCMVANMLKALVHHGRVKTTLTKAKGIRGEADKLITLAKRNDLASRRNVIADLMIKRSPKKKSVPGRFVDRDILQKLFGELSSRFAGRSGGYTRIIRLNERRGDNAPLCFLEYVSSNTK